jgi:hypothetical protein
MRILGTLHAKETPPAFDAERQRLMAEFSIGFDGRHYTFGPYRYGRLADAVAFAQANPLEPSFTW